MPSEDEQNFHNPAYHCKYRSPKHEEMNKRSQQNISVRRFNVKPSRNNPKKTSLQYAIKANT